MKFSNSAQQVLASLLVYLVIVRFGSSFFESLQGLQLIDGSSLGFLGLQPLLQLVLKHIVSAQKESFFSLLTSMSVSPALAHVQPVKENKVACRKPSYRFPECSHVIDTCLTVASAAALTKWSLSLPSRFPRRILPVYYFLPVFVCFDTCHTNHCWSFVLAVAS